MTVAKLKQGDCLEVIKTLQDGSIDALISDIPYGIDYSEWDVIHNNTNSALLGKSPAQSKSKLFKTRGKPLNGWSAEDRENGKNFEDFCTTWLKEVYRVTKPASPLLIMCGRKNQHRLVNALESAGFVYKDYLVWDKMNAPFRAQNVTKVLENEE